uniref:Uncharacterized protein n=1 Tax=Brassica oleracea TaxID=3712 RepID=A0A3P6DWD0_BRAOL|nr:unnamed protein product [Brassica oleracea]
MSCIRYGEGGKGYGLMVGVLYLASKVFTIHTSL